MPREYSAYENFTDEELIDRLRNGDAQIMDYICNKYKNLVRSKAKSMYILGADNEDLIQEGMVGLLTAIRKYDPTRDAAFRTFATVCIRSRLASAVRAAQGDKHSPLNHSISFEPPLFDGTDLTLSVENPEDVIIGREELKERLDALKGQLSEFEASILPPYLNGMSCGEIARRYGKSSKSVDNAIQRIRRKMARQTSGESSES